VALLIPVALLAITRRYSEITMALEYLEREGLATCEKQKTARRDKEIWYATS
jgi:transcription initiation factor IIE alpha subunit